MDDFELLQAYAVGQAEDAFTALTKRYINLVYSAAVRQTGDDQAAEDVTQAVFLTLARKAGSISRETILSGWLLRTTRFAAANARRLEQRRQHYEQQAMQSYVQPTEPAAAWQRIAPLLDDALDRLGNKDRDAVVLRFFEQQSLKHVAEKLGMSEDGAQKRVSRALEKLRLFFVRHGRNVPTTVLASLLAANSVQAAPTTLLASVCALVGSKSVLTTDLATTLAHATVRGLSRARWQGLTVRLGSLAVLVSLAVFLLVRVNKPALENDGPTVPTPPLMAEPPAPRIETPVFNPAAVLPGDEKVLQLRVVDAASAAPVTNARLTLVSIGQASQRITNTFVSDAQGVGAVVYSTIPVKSWSHRIEIFRDGYVPKFVRWSEYQQDSLDEIPEEFTAKLDPAVTIGGMVTDEQEAPVPGLQVVFTVTGPTASRARETLTMMGNYHTEVTDARGQWSCNHVPPRFGMIEYRLVHPQFQEKTYRADSPDSPAYIKADRISEADLLARRAVLRAIRGLTIAGRVTDENGQPVAGAKVTQGFAFHLAERNLFTEADGSFRFGNGRPRELSLTVQAEGLAPIVTSFVMSASIENLQVALPQGRTLLGRVVDENDQPIAGAAIEAASPSADSRTLFEWRVRTDDAGRFLWDTAPAQQEYAIIASGYELERRVKLVADTTEQVIRLKKRNSASVRILGQIIDAESKLPPASARVQIWETRRESGGGLSSFTTRPEDTASDGQFRLKTSSGTIRYVLEAQADGYWPERLTNEVAGTGEVQLTFALKKAPLFAGVVLTPKGGPAAGATVVICGPQEWAQMNQAGKLQISSHNGVVGVIADAQGRFRLPPKYSAESIVISHAEGFAELPFSKMSSNSVIVLEAWGRIEGTARIGAKPPLGETIRLVTMPSLGSRSRLSLHVAAITDAEGHFLFESVPPGEWKVNHEINPKAHERVGVHFPIYSHGVPVVVWPGEIANVVLGGSGRPVVGQAIPPDTKVAIAWIENAVTLTLKGPDHQHLQRQYGAMFSPDGSFRIEGVPPGDYLLKINLAEPPKHSSQVWVNTSILATLEMDLTVPALTTDSAETPHDLGALQLMPAPAQRAVP